MPKNSPIEKELSLYLEHLNRTDYIKSYKKMAKDSNLLSSAEEGMADYFKQIEHEAK